MSYLSTTLLNNFNYSFYESISIFLISFFSNTFSAISGGGAGLLQLPALILAGVPYYQALASHKLATVALGLGGSLRNYKSLNNDIYIAWQILIFGLPGVILGSSIVKFISEQYLYLFLGIISILLAIYSFFKSDLGLSSKNHELNLIQKFRFFNFYFPYRYIEWFCFFRNWIACNNTFNQNLRIGFSSGYKFDLLYGWYFLEFYWSNFFE